MEEGKEKWMWQKLQCCEEKKVRAVQAAKKQKCGGEQQLLYGRPREEQIPKVW